MHYKKRVIKGTLASFCACCLILSVSAETAPAETSGTTSVQTSETKSAKTTIKKEKKHMFKNENDEISYIIGHQIAENIVRDGLKTELNQKILVQALTDGLNGHQSEITQAETQTIMRQFFTKMEKAKGKKNKEAGQAFLEKNKQDASVVTLPSGVQYKILEAGTGAKPTVSDTVTVDYEGTLIDGTVFDSSYKRGEPVSFPVSGVIKGWTEALQLMPTGSTWMLYIPADLAYGAHGPSPAIGPDSTLVFKVHLISIAQKPAAKK